jgi:hypothetical protein
MGTQALYTTQLILPYDAPKNVSLSGLRGCELLKIGYVNPR